MQPVVSAVPASLTVPLPLNVTQVPCRLSAAEHLSKLLISRCILLVLSVLCQLKVLCWCFTVVLVLCCKGWVEHGAG